jgi:hypothetical protein
MVADLFEEEYSVDRAGLVLVLRLVLVGYFREPVPLYDFPLEVGLFPDLLSVFHFFVSTGLK